VDRIAQVKARNKRLCQHIIIVGAIFSVSLVVLACFVTPHDGRYKRHSKRAAAMLMVMMCACYLACGCVCFYRCNGKTLRD